jgi:hypothetical protein
MGTTQRGSGRSELTAHAPPTTANNMSNTGPARGNNWAACAQRRYTGTSDARLESSLKFRWREEVVARQDQGPDSGKDS